MYCIRCGHHQPRAHRCRSCEVVCHEFYNDLAARKRLPRATFSTRRPAAMRASKKRHAGTVVAFLLAGGLLLSLCAGIASHVLEDELIRSTDAFREADRYVATNEALHNQLGAQPEVGRVTGTVMSNEASFQVLVEGGTKEGLVMLTLHRSAHDWQVSDAIYVPGGGPSLLDLVLSPESATQVEIVDLQTGRAPGKHGLAGQKLTEKSTGEEEDPEIARLRARCANEPDSFHAHQTLDHALAKRGRFEEVVAVWDAFITRHPDNPGAYAERGGAHHHLKNAEAAQKDIKTACELGYTAGCPTKKR